MMESSLYQRVCEMCNDDRAEHFIKSLIIGYDKDSNTKMSSIDFIQELNLKENCEEIFDTIEIKYKEDNYGIRALLMHFDAVKATNLELEEKKEMQNYRNGISYYLTNFTSNSTNPLNQLNLMIYEITKVIDDKTELGLTYYICPDDIDIIQQYLDKSFYVDEKIKQEGIIFNKNFKKRYMEIYNMLNLKKNVS